MKSAVKWLLSFSLLQAIVLCLIVSFRYVNLESTITLLIFNFLFASLIFQLNGTFNRKLGILAIGNGVGLCWNFVFYSFSLAGTLYFGKVFEGVYTVVYPLLNIMWVVPFWSLSLGFLPKCRTRAERVTFVD
jgi:hypothetical protein